MARYEHIAIFQSAYILTLEIYRSVSNFKKEHKYTLGEKLKLICHGMLDLIMIANSEKNKNEYLRKLEYKTETLRIYLRLAFDLKIISAGYLEKTNKQLEEIKKQIGGWQKWASGSN
jgi:four helix bundle protein